MKKIASFTVNHDILEKGMYISRIDGDIVTYDVRMKKPNCNDFLQNAAMHTFEHLFATYARNTKYAENIIYIGPMGCRTGFYFLVRDKISHAQALQIMKDCFEFIKQFKGEIPGTKKEECGNYLDHDLTGAKEIATDMAKVLENWTVEKMTYAK
jgi:S-ribosylhomocysteine lyase